MFNLLASIASFTADTVGIFGAVSVEAAGEEDVFHEASVYVS